MLNSIFKSYFKNGITDTMSDDEAYEIGLYNESILKSIPLALILTSIFLYLRMDLAFVCLSVSLVYFFYEGFFGAKNNIPLRGLFTSLIMCTIYLVCTIYYGFSYGFQYLLMISFAVSLINIHDPAYRKYFLIYCLILFSAAAVYLVLREEAFPQTPYGEIINLLLILMTFLMAVRISSSFMELNLEVKQKKLEELRVLKLQNEKVMSFNHSVAHDLKEPLRSIGSFSKLLFKNTDQSKHKESLKFNDFIQSAVSRIDKLLDDLMSFIEAGDKQHLENEISLDMALVNAKENLHQKIIELNPEIYSEPLVNVRGNLSTLSLLFQNLLNNAMKFVEKDKRPIIEISQQEVEGGIEIQFKDNGIGISEEYQAMIFEPFKRLHNKTKYEGSGLGLSLCNKIAKQLDGHMSVSSISGEGSCFKLFIPQHRIVKDK